MKVYEVVSNYYGCEYFEGLFFDQNLALQKMVSLQDSLFDIYKLNLVVEVHEFSGFWEYLDSFASSFMDLKDVVDFFKRHGI